jgi:two-component system, NarL family, invasion response regulator UvrY
VTSIFKVETRLVDMQTSTGEDSGPLRSEGSSALVRILVVDDNPAVRHYLRSILEQQSTWRVCSEARTGEEALEKVQNSVPDLVLLDFQMPDLNGLDVAREIYRIKPKIPILMITVHMSDQLAAAAKAVGIRGACAKSDVGSIVVAVQALLQEKTYFPTLISEGGELQSDISDVKC